MMRLVSGSGDWSCSCQSWLSLLGDASQQLLDLGDGSAGVETLGAGLGAVHDSVTSARKS